MMGDERQNLLLLLCFEARAWMEDFLDWSSGHRVFSFGTVCVHTNLYKLSSKGRMLHLIELPHDLFIDLAKDLPKHMDQSVDLIAGYLHFEPATREVLECLSPGIPVL